MLPLHSCGAAARHLLLRLLCCRFLAGDFRDSHAAAAQVWDPERVIIIPDHYIFTSDPRANRNVDILR